MKAVEKYSYGYEIARSWVRWTLRGLFYRKVVIRGLEKIDPKKPIIIAGNHQNALIDALNILSILKAQPIFLARADIFKKKTMAIILNWMKIIPVFRIRDGFDSLQKNDEVFEKCAKILSKGRSLAIFPEGNHGDYRTLRMLKKGLARVAFGAEKVRNYELGVQIVPIGLDYSHFEKFRARVSISIGDPIIVNDFSDLYKEDVQKGYRALNDEIRKRLFPHMIDVPWQAIYEGVMGMRSVYGKIYREKNNLPGKTIFNRFDADKKLIDDIREVYEEKPEQTEEISNKLVRYLKSLDRMNLRNHILEAGSFSLFRLLGESMWLVLMSPLFLYGLVNNFVVFTVPHVLTRTKIKDKQFRSSVAYVLAFVILLPLFLAIQTLIIAVVFKTWWITLAYLISIIPLGLFAIHYSFWFKKTRARLKFWYMSLRKNPKIISLVKTRKELISDLDSLIS